MDTFLKQLAQEIAERYDNPKDLCLVLPSKRAVTFLKQELAKAYNSTFWAPEFFSLGEFVERLAPFKKEEKLILILELYESYLKIAGNEPEDIESFLKWAPTLLGDFAEIDRYLIDSSDIFSYINEARALEYWNVNGEPLTAAQNNYLHFWKLLGKLYDQFQKDLLKKGVGYAGMQFRWAADNFKNWVEEISFEKVIFAGFNALSAAEEKIVFGLIKAGMAEVFWDADRYYMENYEQEAGLFLRRIQKKYHSIPFQWIGDSLSVQEKQINVVACNTDFAQTQYASEVLQTIYNKENPFRTAVVLNNEELLLPMLYNLPANVEAANITMGYSLKQSPLASFINICIDLWGNYRDQKEGRAFYFKNVFRLVEHPYFEFIAYQKELSVSAFKEEMARRNVIYVLQSDIQRLFNKGFDINNLLPLTEIKPKSASEVFLKLFSVLKEGIAEKDLSDLEKSVHTEYLYSYTVVVRKFLNVLAKSHHLNDIGLKTFKRLLNQLVGSEALSFFGEPLKGLQIMGMLETRLLDFEHLIILSTNEGVLPQGKKENSFIPFDIKREFNLPTHTEHDAVFANHFYRLIQKASKIDLVYLNGKNDFGASTEKSRFIEQLQFELPRVNPKVSIQSRGYAPGAELNPLQVEFEKTDEVIDKITSILEGGISPSAFNKFIQCPLDFYYRYVLGLGEADEVEENLKHSTFGTCVHETLEELYKPFVGKPLKLEHIKAMEKLVNSVLNEKFLEYLSKTDLKSGNNLLTFEVAQQYIKSFLKNEKKTILKAQEKKQDYIVLEQEEVLECILPVDVSGREIKVKIRGFADRIGKLGTTFQLIDYKTGNVTSTDLSISNWDTLATDSKKSKALQLALYGLAYLDKHPEVNDFVAGIYSFRNSKAGLLSLKANRKIASAESIRSEMSGVVEQIVQDMLNLDEVIQHDSESKYCNYC